MALFSFGFIKYIKIDILFCHIRTICYLCKSGLALFQFSGMERHYGFKHVDEKYRKEALKVIEEIRDFEDDDEVYDRVSFLLRELSCPEESRLESCCDSMDSIEDYYINRLSFFGGEFEDDKVYKWLDELLKYFTDIEAYELCYNIKRAIEIIKEMKKREDMMLNIDDVI